MLFRDIRIPACRSDIARLALLHAVGGTYIDAHTGPGCPDALAAYLRMTRQYDVVLTEINPRASPVPYNRIFNSPMAGKAGSFILVDLLRRALGNLYHYRALESAEGVGDGYRSVFQLTGPRMVRSVVVDFSSRPLDIKRAYKDRLAFASMAAVGDREPLSLYRYRDYRDNGNHWSIREQTENLFYSTSEKR